MVPADAISELVGELDSLVPAPGKLEGFCGQDPQTGPKSTLETAAAAAAAENVRAVHLLEAEKHYQLPAAFVE
jgi:hypothetical protein